MIQQSPDSSRAAPDRATMLAGRPPALVCMTRPNLAPASRSAPDLDRLVRKAYAAHGDGDLRRADRLYRAALAHDPDNFDLLHFLGDVSFQRGRLDDALRFLAAAVARNARSAAALSDLAFAQHTLARYEEALASHTAALALEPENPDLINRYAITLIHLGRAEPALAALDRALARAPEYVAALGNRGNALLRLNRPADAIVAYDAALRIAGEDAQLLTNRAHALRRLDRVEEALAELVRATAIRPDFAEARFELALAQLTLGDFAAGWRTYEWRWAAGSFAPHRRSFTSPLWTGDQALAGKTVLLHAEQGFGDTIQFVRYVPLVARLGARVVLEVEPALVSLLAGLAGAATVIARGEKLPRFDLHCPLMSLPRAFATRPEDIPAAVPYLAASAARADHWAQRLPALRPRVGIAWAGDATHANDLNRSLPLALLAPLLRQDGAAFVSLQRELRAGDAAILDTLANVARLGEGLVDFADTAALIAQLDLVVAVDTSVAHLAGALGKPLILLLPYAADFRWMRGREDSPWYPTARLMRQAAFNDWSAVMARLPMAMRACAGPS